MTGTAPCRMHRSRKRSAAAVAHTVTVMARLVRAMTMQERPWPSGNPPILRLFPRCVNLAGTAPGHDGEGKDLAPPDSLF